MKLLIASLLLLASTSEAQSKYVEIDKGCWKNKETGYAWCEKDTSEEEPQVSILDFNGNNITSFGGSGGTASGLNYTNDGTTVDRWSTPKEKNNENPTEENVSDNGERD